MRIDNAYETVLPVNKTAMEYHKDMVDAPFRTDLKSLQISQPDGPSFTVRVFLNCCGFFLVTMKDLTGSIESLDVPLAYWAAPILLARDAPVMYVSRKIPAQPFA